MHKREILLVLSAFLSIFILLLFIGLAGPNVTKQDKLTASDIFKEDKINNISASTILANGPFAVTTPSMSTYSQQLCLFLLFHLKNEETSESFNKDIEVFIKIEGENDDEKKYLISDSLRKFQLYCSGKICDPIEVLHLAFVQYSKYQVTIKFAKLQSVHDKYVIDDITFSFQSINSSFTTLSIWFRFFFLVTSFLITCWFTHSLHKYPFADWSLEQKWTSLLLVLLLVFDNPLYPMQFLFGSSLPRLMEIFFECSLLCAIQLFWLCFFHGIRQNNRTWSKFYAPKIILVGTLWFIMFYTMSWAATNKLNNPLFDEVNQMNQSAFLQFCNFIFYFILFIYFIYLFILIINAVTELRSMPYFDVRLKLQIFLISFVLTIAVLVIALSYSSSMMDNISVSRIPFLQLLPFTYQSSSSAAFLSLFAITNLYVCICAYFYQPSINALMDARVVRDNPTLSMINDSDEDVIYGSDTEEPLNQPKLIDTKNDEEESD